MNEDQHHRITTIGCEDLVVVHTPGPPSCAPDGVTGQRAPQPLAGGRTLSERVLGIDLGARERVWPSPNPGFVMPIEVLHASEGPELDSALDHAIREHGPHRRSSVCLSIWMAPKDPQQRKSNNG